MDCPGEHVIAAFVGGALSEEPSRALYAHLDACVACRELVAALGRDEDDGATERAARMGRFEILDVLGAGSTGLVYRAHDPVLRRDVALKLLAHAAGDDHDLLREAQALARLSHPNVTAVYEVGETPEGVFIALELVEGETLRSRLAGGPLPPGAVVDALTQTGRGLAAAHAAGILHGDVKPENVVLRPDGRACLLDFGLAGTADEAALGGTALYAAPERLRGGPATPASDQYALSLSFYEALIGERPFVGETIAEIRAAALAGRLRRPGPRAADAPAWLVALLVRGASADPRERFPSVEALVSEVERARDRGRRAWPLWAFGVAFGGVVTTAAIAVPLVSRGVGRPAASAASAATATATSAATPSAAWPVGRVAWDDIGALDREAEARFYVSLFGWRGVDAPHPRVGIYTTMFAGAAPVAGLYEINAEARARGVPPHWLAYVAVADAETSTREAERAGWRVVSGPAAGGNGRIGIVRAPAGGLLGALAPERPFVAASPTTLGAVAAHELEIDGADEADAARTKALYRAWPGWESRDDALIGADGAAAATLRVRRGGGGARWIAWVNVLDCGEAVRRALALGATLEDGCHDSPLGRGALVRDPEGIVFGVRARR